VDQLRSLDERMFGKELLVITNYVPCEFDEISKKWVYEDNLVSLKRMVKMNFRYISIYVTQGGAKFVEQLSSTLLSSYKILCKNV
jgi:hypothetical protein